MNSHQRRKQRRVGVQRGFGPRHAFNAQEGEEGPRQYAEGDEAVPSSLPEPPPEDLRVRPNSMGNLRPAMLAKMLGKELGGLSKEDVAKIGISLLMGGEGPEAMPVGGVPKMGKPGLKLPETVARYEGPDATPSGGSQSFYPGQSLEHNFEAGPDGKLQPKKEYSDALDELEKVLIKQAQKGSPPDNTFPSLNKPPYDALKDEGFAPGEPGSDAHYEKWLEGKKFKDEGAASDAYWQEIGASDKAAHQEFLDKHTHDFEVQPDMTLNEVPPEEPPFKPNVPRYGKGSKGVRKFRGYSPVRAAGGEAEKTKVGVEKGFGPRHSANSKEGTDLTKINSDVVPAMLTPREAVLNRNAAELAGRGNIEALNAQGNKLAKEGVDLAAEGDEDVPFPMRVPPQGAEGLQEEQAQRHEELMLELEDRLRARGVPPLRGLSEGEEAKDTGHVIPGYRVLAAKGTSDMKNSKQKPSQKPVPAYGKLPAPPQAQPAAQRGGFYPPGRGPFGMAEGDASVPGGIGRPNPQMAYDPRAQVDFKAPDLSGFLKDMRAEAQKRGISQDQLAGIAKQFAGMGGGGGQLAGNYAAAGSPTPVYGESGYPSAIPVGGYQGGISEIGYPPMLMPNAEYHADKGSTWEGPYDPQYLVQRYAGGTGEVPGLRRGEGDFRGGGGGGFGASTMAWGGDRPSWNPNAFPPDLPPIGVSPTPNLDRDFQGNSGGYNNRSSWQGGAPGFPWSPTAIPTTYDPQGYPFAVPVQGPDQNLQGVGRTHNLRKNQ